MAQKKIPELASIKERIGAVEEQSEHCPFSRRKQCDLLGLNRSTFYYVPTPETPENLALMREIDELHLNFPFLGTRKMTDQLNAENHREGPVNRKRVQRLMRKMGIEAIYPKPRTTIPDKEHKIFPYLLGDLKVERPNQVWCSDITYVPMDRGFMYLVAIMDWFSRFVLSWEICNTMDAGFCLAALSRAVEQWGKAEIFNTDQGAQFTANSFTEAVCGAGMQMSMDGKGRWIDNRFIERLWRSYKYEEVYLKAYDDGFALWEGTDEWMDFYCYKRTHQSLGGKTPWEVYKTDA